jgi:uncharacterized protein
MKVSQLRLSVIGPVLGVVLTVFATPGCSAIAGGGRAAAPNSPSVTTSIVPDTPAFLLVAAARAQVGVTTGYDPAYRSLAYPGGDVPTTTGVCSDVVVRALRTLGIDLQQKIHDDMRANFSAYPHKWGLKRPDPNIDHRRVPNLVTYFSRRGYSVPVTHDIQDYLPGDIVAMGVPGVQGHIGIVSDRIANGHPLFIHNVGAGTKEEDVLFAWTITGHYRVM